MKISQLKRNPSNPRLITETSFKKLIASIEEFPQMLEARPIVVDEDNTVLGGNMRLQALISMGYEDIPDKWVKRLRNLPDEKKREFVIKDNAQYGEWDWDILANQWDDLPLEDWTVEIPRFELGDVSIDKLEAKEKPTDGKMCPNCGAEIK